MDAADPLVRVIRREPDDSHAPPNLDDYDALRASFTWDQARGWLDGLPAGGTNIAHEAVDRHVTHGRHHVANQIAITRHASKSPIQIDDM